MHTNDTFQSRREPVTGISACHNDLMHTNAVTINPLLTSYFTITFLSKFFFFNDTATTEIYTLSLHDALPISRKKRRRSTRLLFVPRSMSGLPTVMGKGPIGLCHTMGIFLFLNRRATIVCRIHQLGG